LGGIGSVNQGENGDFWGLIVLKGTKKEEFPGAM
jgi:hypothetical protein